ncbi:MAG: methyltransferase [Alphaproteobacteria bacterium]
MTGALRYKGWRAIRNRLLASQKFQRWASRFPLTRPIANRRARALFDICAGFVYSQVLLTCVRLGLFDLLAEHPKSTQAVSEAVQLPPESTLLLLKAATSLGLVEKIGDGVWGLGPLGLAMRGNPSIAGFVEHHAMLYGDLEDPVALLRGEKQDTALGNYWKYAGSPEARATDEQVARYSTLMANSQEMIADDILDAFDLGHHKCLLDIGGGEGVFLVRALNRFDQLRAILFDLPPVADRALSRFVDAGLDNRAAAIGGSFMTDSLPDGADVISLIRVLHDHHDETVMTVLRAAREALPPGGTLLVGEPMAGVRGARPIGDAYFGFYLLAMGSGRPRSPQEYDAMLRDAGFVDVRQARTARPLLTGLLVAKSPGSK